MMNKTLYDLKKNNKVTIYNRETKEFVEATVKQDNNSTEILMISFEEDIEDICFFQKIENLKVLASKYRVIGLTKEIVEEWLKDK